MSVAGLSNDGYWLTLSLYPSVLGHLVKSPA